MTLAPRAGLRDAGTAPDIVLPCVVLVALVALLPGCDGPGGMPGWLARTFASLGIGGGAGAALGFGVRRAMRQVLRAVAGGAGLVVLLLVGAECGGLVDVPWGRVGETVWPLLSGRAFGEEVRSLLATYVPGAGGFGAGFVLGYRKG